MFLINLPIGYYYFGFDAIVGLITTFILCLILSVGMGGGDVKIFTALAPIFSNDFIFYIPKGILYIIVLSMILSAIFPMYKIFVKYYKDIILTSGYLATVIGILYLLIFLYNIPYGKLIIWVYVIISIILSKRYKNYKNIMKKLGYLYPVYLILVFFIKPYYLYNSIIYFLEICLISILIYALTGEVVAEKKKIDELKEGDILRDVIIIDKNNVIIKNLNIIQRIKFLISHEIQSVKNKNDKVNIIICDGEGLLKEDLEKLKKLYKEGKIKEVNIIKTYPFLPFVLVSYVITLFIMYVKV